MLKKCPIMLFNAFFSKRAFNAEINAGIMCDTLLQVPTRRTAPVNVAKKMAATTLVFYRYDTYRRRVSSSFILKSRHSLKQKLCSSRRNKKFK